MESLDQLTWLLAELNAKQQLVARLFRKCSEARWVASRPGDHPSFTIVSSRGHFPYHGHELEWSPQELCGHLADMARLDAERIRLLREDPDGPKLPAFDESDPARLAQYRRMGRLEAQARLADAQQVLLFRAAGVQQDEVDRVGHDPVDGTMSLREVLTAATEHQADHGHQLAVLIGRG